MGKNCHDSRFVCVLGQHLPLPDGGRRFSASGEGSRIAKRNRSGLGGNRKLAHRRKSAPWQQRILARNAITYTHQARQIGAQDLDDFDYIIVMDNMNLDDVLALGASSQKVSRLLEYVWGSPVLEVPDPYYTDRFDEVYDLVRAGCEGLLARIRADHAL